MNIRYLRTQDLTLDEIWANWVNNGILENLVQVSNLTNLIFKRYYDEYCKTKDLGNHTSLIQTLLHTVDFSLKILLLIQIYREYLQYYHPSPDLQLIENSIIVQEKHYLDIFLAFVHSDHINQSSEIRSLIEAIEVQNSNRRILRHASNSADLTSYKAAVMKLAKFYLDFFTDLMGELVEDFWIADLLLQNFVSNEATKQIANFVQLDEIAETESKEEILKSLGGPIPRYKSKISSSQLLVDISKRKIHDFNLKEGIVEIKTILHSLERLNQELVKFSDKKLLQSFYQTSELLYQESNLLNLLNELAHFHTELVSSIDNKNEVMLRKALRNIKSLLEGHDYSFDIEYLSALPTIYDSIVTNLELILNSSVDYDQMKKQIEHRFESIERRIVTVTNQMVQKFENIGDSSELRSSDSVNYLINQAEILRLTNSLLPESIPSRFHNDSRLKIIIDLAKSIKFEIRAFNSSQDNQIVELIFKIRAYYYANSAYFEFNNLKTTDVPIGRIKAQYSGSFISSNQLLVQLFLISAQYLSINEVIPLLSRISTEIDKSDDRIYHSWVTKLDDLDLFENIINQIIHQTTILQEHNQIHGAVTSELNWSRIKELGGIAQSVLYFFRSVKDFFLGSIALQTGLEDDGTIHLEEAKQSAFTSSTILQKFIVNDSEHGNLPNQLFNFGKYCQSYSSQIQKKKIEQSNIANIFKILRNLVFMM